MEKKVLYVGNLPFSVNDEELREAFSQIGEVVSAKVIIEHPTERSKGFGFVEMATEELAKSAIAEMDQKLVGGRTIRVSEAKPKINKY